MLRHGLIWEGTAGEINCSRNLNQLMGQPRGDIDHMFGSSGGIIRAMKRHRTVKRANQQPDGQSQWHVPRNKHFLRRVNRSASIKPRSLASSHVWGAQVPGHGQGPEQGLDLAGGGRY